MWGTIARMRVREGVPDEYFVAQLRAFTMDHAPGWVSTSFMRSDENPRELWMVAMFADKESYQANAASSTQHAIFQTLRSLLDEDPQWHDVDELVSTAPKQRD